jgi:hypothetical protein
VVKLKQTESRRANHEWNEITSTAQVAKSDANANAPNKNLSPLVIIKVFRSQSLGFRCQNYKYARTPGGLLMLFVNANGQTELKFHSYTAWRLPQIEEISRSK